MFVAVEGIDGCGKSTTISRIMHLANKHHIANVYAKETTQTAMGRSIRQAVLSPSVYLTKSEQATAFAIARLECLKKITIPALLKNELVIGDRYMLSSLAYQANLKSFTNDLGLNYTDATNVLGINKTVLGYYWTVPTFYAYISLNPKDNVKRLQQRTRKQDTFDKKLANLPEMLRLKENYTFAMSEISTPVMIINGKLTKNQRGGQIFQRIHSLIMKKRLKTFDRYW